jgi:hypothetical protein
MLRSYCLKHRASFRGPVPQKAGCRNDTNVWPFMLKQLHERLTTWISQRSQPLECLNVSFRMAIPGLCITAPDRISLRRHVFCENINFRLYV